MSRKKRNRQKPQGRCHNRNLWKVRSTKILRIYADVSDMTFRTIQGSNPLARNKSEWILIFKPALCRPDMVGMFERAKSSE